MKTDYAEPERTQISDIEKQAKDVSSQYVIVESLKSSNTLFMILNARRQIVFANKMLLELFNCSLKKVLGKRPGEIFSCVNSTINEGGCGTSRLCQYCGAVNAILEALNGKNSEKECRISSFENGRNTSYDLQVSARPVTFENESYIFFSVIDISDKKRKEILEKTFFHDLLNTAGGMIGLTHLLQDQLKGHNEDSADTAELICDLTDKLLSEIQTHRKLLSAENGDLEVSIKEFSLNEFLESIAKTVQTMNHQNTYGQSSTGTETRFVLKKHKDLKLQTDSTLLQKILLNMIKNAAEAPNCTPVVTIDTEILKNEVCFRVHNDFYIAQETQGQIFQRSFSTKGSNRGIGTYSMKIFGENYLNGKVEFSSDPENGTVFTLKIPLKLKSLAK